MIDQKEKTPSRDIQFVFAAKELLSAEQLYQLADLNYEYGSPWSIRGFQGDLSTPQTRYLIAYAGEKIVGYIGYHQIVDEADITNLVVDQRFQQKGVASQLMQLCIEKWRTDQVTKVFLEVRRNNQAAIKLYQKQQFLITGERKNYYTNPLEDAIIMQRKV